MIADVVRSMGHIWRETAGDTDYGIDGDIELRDPGSGRVYNQRIGVQSKATRNRWAGETDEHFTFTPTENHLSYWLSGSAPVLLICSRPATGEIYWRSIQEWARDPDARATRKVTFDKTRDVFNETVRDHLFDLKADAADRVEPPTPAHTPETMTSNLMPVIWKSEALHSAAIPSADIAQLLAPAHVQGVYDGAAVFRDGYAWSLAPFRPGFIEAIQATGAKSGSLRPFLDSDEKADLNLVRELVRRSVLASRRRWLVWHGQRHVAYFRRDRQDWQPVRYRWGKGTGRTVVSPQKAKTREGYTGLRHDAARLAVRRLDGVWFVQITPTYLFTWDGRKVSGHHHSALSGIKKTETHPSVSQALRMWAHLLGEHITLDGDPHPLALGSLVPMVAPRSIYDQTWKRVSATDLGYGHDDAAPTLFDVGDGA